MSSPGQAPRRPASTASALPVRSRVSSPPTRSGSARTAWIRAELHALLAILKLDIPADSLDPFVDFLVEKIVAKAQLSAAPEGEAG